MKYNILLLLFLIPACHSPTGPESGELTDIDGNVYRTISIGDQWWMAENLKVTRYRNGDDIPNVTGNDEWSALESGAWAYYNNNPEYDRLFGKLYNWYAANDERRICPEGWRVPSEVDWEILIIHLGGMNTAGGKMKDTTLWVSPNEGATNESGFTGRPGGYRLVVGNPGRDGTFENLGRSGMWWYRDDVSRARDLFYLRANAGVTRFDQWWGKRWGYSIRCIRE